MATIVPEDRVKAEREEYERLSRELNEYLKKEMKGDAWYTREGLHGLASDFLKKKKIEPNGEDFIPILLIYSDTILDRVTTLQRTYYKLNLEKNRTEMGQA